MLSVPPLRLHHAAVMELEGVLEGEPTALISLDEELVEVLTGVGISMEVSNSESCVSRHPTNY